MSHEQDKQRIREAIGRILNCDPSSITDTAHLGKDIQVDSLFVLEIAFSVEAMFGVKFAEDSYPHLTTVEAITQQIRVLKGDGTPDAARAGLP